MMMMDSRGGTDGGGCCVERYESEKMYRIMLKFRPIAPKLTAGGSSPENTSSSGGDTYVKIGRGKRRYNSDVKINGGKRRIKTSPEPVTTLPLLPELNESGSKRSSPIWLNFNSGATEKDEVDHTVNNENNKHHRPINNTPDPTVVIPPRGTRGTCVSLECLTYTMVNVDAIGWTDNERVMNLERDTCPGFVSDSLNRITWSNAGFRKMVEVGSGWVEMKEGVGMDARAFSCRVKVQVEDSKSTRKSKTMTVPCDVWRMDCGGFAWRLDVKAALSLAL